jgi:hypothetical protein
MQYLLGNYQSAPQFTQDDMYRQYAPNIQAANNSMNPAFKQASDMIKSGTPSWELWTNKGLIKSSGLKADEWKDFIEALVKEQQEVLNAMIKQNTEQDYFQRQGMPGAKETYLDKTPEGKLKNIGAAYKFAPEQFNTLIGDLPQKEAADAARKKDIDAKYGSVFETDRDKILKMLYDESLSKRNTKEIEKVKGKRTYSIDPLTGTQVVKWDNPKRRFEGDDLSYVDGRSIDWFNNSGIFDDKRPDVAKQMVRSFLGLKGSQWFGLKPLVDRIATSIGVNNPRDQRGFAMSDALNLLKAQGTRPLEDKRSSAIGRSDANAINAYMDRKQGSGVNTQRQAAELASQVLASLAQQGATPLKTDIMRNAMLKRSTRNG